MAKIVKLGLGLLAVNLILITLLAVFSLTTLVSWRGLISDFTLHWVGGRAFWSGRSPYSREVTRQTQETMLGRPFPPDADQHQNPYLAYSSILLAPVIALPAPIAIATWMAVQLVAIMWTSLIWMAMLRWRLSPLPAIGLMLALAFFFHYPIDTFVLGQFSGTVLLSVTLAFWLLALGQDYAAGIVFVGATLPPTVGGPLAVGLLGAYALRGRWHGLAAFVVTVGALFVLSILRIGWWIPDWLGVLREYSRYARPIWPPEFLPPVLRIMLVGGVVVLLVFAVLRFRRSPDVTAQAHSPTDIEIDLAVTALLAALLLLPQTGYYYLVLLIPVIIVCLHRASSLPPAARYIVWLSCLLIVFSPWVYLSLPGLDSDAQSLIVPLHVGLTWVAVNLVSKERRAVWLCVRV